MADKELVSLPESAGVTDDTLFLIYQPGAADPAQKLTAEQLVKYAGSPTAEIIKNSLGYVPANEENIVGRKGTGEGAEVFNSFLNNTATGMYGHAEGWNTEAPGKGGAHAEGRGTIASGNNGCHAEGYESEAAGGYGSHAEGRSCLASGSDGSHAEGHSCLASGSDGSHAEGHGTIAAGDSGCHAEGKDTISNGESQHVQGRYNIPDDLNKFAHIVGNGSANRTRSNAHTLDWEGNAWFAGDVYVGSTSGTNMDDGSKKLATVAEVGEMIGKMPGGDVTAESIKTALGYTPANAETVSQLSEEKLDKPTTAGTAGQFLTSDGNGGTTWVSLSMYNGEVEDA